MQTFQVFGTITVIISITLTSAFLGGKNEDVLIEHQESNCFMFINKVKGLRMETNVDTQRILVVEI